MFKIHKATINKSKKRKQKDRLIEKICPAHSLLFKVKKTEEMNFLVQNTLAKIDYVKFGGTLTMRQASIETS